MVLYDPTDSCAICVYYHSVSYVITPPGALPITLSNQDYACMHFYGGYLQHLYPCMCKKDTCMLCAT